MKKLVELDAALEGLENLNAISFYEANEHSKEAYTETKDMLKALPIVDAVPVVRCRDCEHKDRESGFCHGRGWPMQLVPDDGFCDKGKDGDGND